MEQNKNIISFNDLKNRKGWKCGMATLPKAHSGKSVTKENIENNNKTEKE